MRDHLLLAQKAQEEEEQEAEANAVEDAGGNNGQDTDRAREQA
jgi:hypothetical protein